MDRNWAIIMASWIGFCVLFLFPLWHCCPVMPSGECFVDCTGRNYKMVCENTTSPTLHSELLYLAGLRTNFSLRIWNSPAITRIGGSIMANASDLITNLELQNLPNLAIIVDLRGMSALLNFTVRNAPLLQFFTLELIPPNLINLELYQTGIRKFYGAQFVNLFMDRSSDDSTQRDLQRIRISNHKIEYLTEFFISFAKLVKIDMINCEVNLASVSTPNYMPFHTNSPLRRLRLVNSTFVAKSSEDNKSLMEQLLKNLNLAPDSTVEIVNTSLVIGTEAPRLIISQLANVSRLSLRNTKFEDYTFANALFVKHENLEVLDLGDTDFPSEQSGIFAGMPNLQTLKIDGTSLQMLGRINLFRGLAAKNLTYLDLSNTEMRYLPEGLDIVGKNLLELHLSGNRITADKFREPVENGWLPNLRVLDLSHNQMTTFKGRHFGSLKNLRTLDISCNNIKNITAEMFSGLPQSLTTLNITFCTKLSIDEPRIVPREVFRSFPPIKVLHLGSGLFKRWIFLRLQKMPKESLSALEELHLPDNRIAYLHESSSYFEGLTGLKYLNLQRNILQSVGSATFSALVSLEQLNLADNALFAIQKDDFVGLPSLRYLDLSGNGMRMTQKGAFDTLEKLRGLFLSDNYLTGLSDLFDKGGSQLEHLSIRNLGIGCLEPSWFLRFKKLKWIYANDSMAFFMDFPVEVTLEEQLQKTSVHPWSRIQYCGQPTELYQRLISRFTGSAAFLRVSVVDESDVVFQNVLANFATCNKPQYSNIKEIVAHTICPTRV